jgi:RimJ/RimL family protein N-acetyltransferase
LTLYADRQAIAPLLRDHSPEDALAAYYALHHSEIRTKLMVHRDERGHALGFMAVCQTGFDLFQPLAVLHAPTANGADVAAWLLHNGLSPARSYHVLVPPALAPAVEAEMNTQAAATHLLFEARRANFQPVINVLVTSSRGPDGGMRFAIRAADGSVAAESGTNWRSDEFAEVFVHVEFAARGRGLGKSVVSACTTHLLESNLRPLYFVDQDNAESVAIAEALGYTDTGVRERAYVGSLKRRMQDT